jgi:hypothetical protein
VSEAESAKVAAAETESEIQHEVCGFTGTSASRAAAQISAEAQIEPKREVAQRTMSTIGDVSVAASEALNQAEAAPQELRPRPLVLFALLLYVASVGIAWLLAGTSLWVRVVLTPLFPVACAAIAFWRRQTWKFRAKDWRFKLKIWEDALDSVSHEAVNTVNAIRAQLIGFRLANPQVSFPEHLDIINEETRRIDSIVQKAQDPVNWKGRKKKKAEKSASPTEVGEDTRSRIAL